MRILFYKTINRIIIFGYILVIKTFELFLNKVNRSNAIKDQKIDVLLTGTFYSANWINAHLKPLSQARNIRKITVVSNYKITGVEKVEVVYPLEILSRFFGNVPARILTFIWVGIMTRPQIVGGFHLLFNGLCAGLLSKITGSRSLYFCVGGPAEIIGGGIKSENRLFSKIKNPDFFLEKLLIICIKHIDCIVTMGKSAEKYFRDIKYKEQICIIPGGIDYEPLDIEKCTKKFDIIFVGRLAPIKNIPLLLNVIKNIKNSKPDINCIIIGEGSEKEKLEKLADELSIKKNIIFAGYTSNVSEYLKESRIFVLTSETEGLSLAMMEAMSCGVPVIVPDVGDLCDLVKDNYNGYLINNHDIKLYEDRILNLLTNTIKYNEISKNTLKTVNCISVVASSHKWNYLIEKLFK